MKLVSVLLLIARFTFVVSDSERTSMHYTDPREDNVDSPPTTPKPSAAPTIAPSAAPTTSPTTSFSPTTSPSATPTMTPSSAPSSEPTTSMPSSTPSNNPTPSPSSLPSGSPSSAPSKKICDAENGVFGDVNAGEPTAVTYEYNLEVTADADVEGDVLPALEQAIVESVLSEVFSAECGSTRRSLRVDISRKLAVAGISRLPPDEVLTGVTCPSSSSANKCVVVGGSLTLYEDDNGQSGTTVVKDAIKQDMESEAFDDAHDDIVKVTYVELSPQDNAGATTVQGDTASPQVSSNPIGIRVGLLVGGGLVMAAVVGLAYRQRQKGDPEDSETELGTQPPQADAEAGAADVQE